MPARQSNSRAICCTAYVGFSSLIGRLGSSTFRLSTNSSVDVAHGLALLFGLGTKALPSWDSKTRWNNLMGDLAVTITAGSSRHTNSPHPSSREGHHSTVGWISGLLLFDFVRFSRRGDLPGPPELGTINPDAVHDHRQPTRQCHDRLFHPPMPGDLYRQALSQDHFVERTSMLWAAS
jgi:hypothetical protein